MKYINKICYTLSSALLKVNNNMTKRISTYLSVYIGTIIINRYLFLQLLIHIMENKVNFTNTTVHVTKIGCRIYSH